MNIKHLWNNQHLSPYPYPPILYHQPSRIVQARGFWYSYVSSQHHYWQTKINEPGRFFTQFPNQKNSGTSQTNKHPVKQGFHHTNPRSSGGIPLFPMTFPGIGYPPKKTGWVFSLDISSFNHGVMFGQGRVIKPCLVFLVEDVRIAIWLKESRGI